MSILKTHISNIFLGSKNYVKSARLFLIVLYLPLQLFYLPKFHPEKIHLNSDILHLLLC